MTDRIAAAFWAAIGGVRLALALRGHPLEAPAAALAVLAALRLVRRRPAAREAPPAVRLAAWAAVVLPWAAGLDPAPPSPLRPLGEALVGLGLALALWAMAALGEAFGVAPADRGLVTRGPYRLLRHPMYAGELLAFLGYCVAHPSPLAALLLAASAALAALRIRWEERILEGYAAYAARVRWRLLPFVW